MKLAVLAFLLVALARVPSLATPGDDGRVDPADRKLVAPFGLPSQVMTADWARLTIPVPHRSQPLTVAGVATAYTFPGVRLTIIRSRNGALVLVGARAARAFSADTMQKLREACGCAESEGSATSIVSDEGRQFFAFPKLLLQEWQENDGPNKSPEPTPGSVTPPPSATQP